MAKQYTRDDLMDWGCFGQAVNIELNLLTKVIIPATIFGCLILFILYFLFGG